MDDEVTPTCDICHRGMNDSPNVFDYGPATEDDWNGETGNHKYCEFAKTVEDTVENMMNEGLIEVALWPDPSSPLYGMTESKLRPIIRGKDGS